MAVTSSADDAGKELIFKIIYRLQCCTSHEVDDTIQQRGEIIQIYLYLVNNESKYFQNKISINNERTQISDFSVDL